MVGVSLQPYEPCDDTTAAVLFADVIDRVIDSALREADIAVMKTWAHRAQTFFFHSVIIPIHNNIGFELMTMWMLLSQSLKPLIILSPHLPLLYFRLVQTPTFFTNGTGNSVTVIRKECDSTRTHVHT